MKHYFIANPVAGKGKVRTELLPKIFAAANAAEIDYVIHRTMNIGDATRIAQAVCEEEPNEKKRFYACGGDGTLNEVLNGIVGKPNCELAVIPAGTGNDFIRNFSEPAEAFLDIAAQINGNAVEVDCLKYEFLGGDVNQVGESFGYAMNMFNLGFDAQAVVRMSYYKKKPFLKGTGAYIAGVGHELIKLSSVKLEATIEGTVPSGERTLDELYLPEGTTVDNPATIEYEGDVLLGGIGNGGFSGGGFHGIPTAQVSDGLMDVMIIEAVTRRFFISLVGKYQKGTHFHDDRIKKIMKYYRCKSATFRPVDKMVFSIDGECVTVGDVRMSVADEKIKFSLPV
ncbi:MAG: hypothetical protein LBN34_09265 [Clostridiales Family XIII bacterium]|jgi:diacylglycerol kinase family enzyme|nr:hypothetical protein [Clostridiales Family XIII bacterium]